MICFSVGQAFTPWLFSSPGVHAWVVVAVPMVSSPFQGLTGIAGQMLGPRRRQRKPLEGANVRSYCVTCPRRERLG